MHLQRPPPQPSRPRRTPVLLVACIALMIAGIASGSTSRAQTGGVTYSAVADSRLAAINFTVSPGLLFDQLVDAGGAVAQAELDSLGTSRAFASDPYPSESVILLPGLAAGFTEGATSGIVPEYPLVASSSYPTQERDEVGTPPVSLVAESRPVASHSVATNGMGTGEVSVTFDESSASVIARAEASAGSIELSDLLSVSGVRSTAVATKQSSGALDLRSTFEVGRLTIAGQRVPLQGLLGDREDISSLHAGALIDQLAGRGVEIDILPETRTEDSITSAGLRIRWVSDVPALPSELDLPPIPGLPAALALPGGVAGLETVTAEVVVGRTMARVDGRTLPTFEGGLDDGAVTPSSPIDQASTPSAPAAAGGDDGPSSRQATPESPPGDGDSQQASSFVRTSVSADISVARFYPVLFLAGIAGLVISRLMGKLGARGT